MGIFFLPRSTCNLTRCIINALASTAVTYMNNISNIVDADICSLPAPRFLTPAMFSVAGRHADSEGSARAALPAGPGFQPGQIQGVPVPVAHLEEAAPGGLPAGHVGAAAAAAGLLRRRVAPPRPRYQHARDENQIAVWLFEVAGSIGF